MPKVWTKQGIIDLLKRNDTAVINGLLRLYALQTSDEQAGHHTSHVNQMGFNKFDAQFLTDIAEKYQRYKKISPKQLAAVRKAIIKYAGQLVSIANELEKDKHPTGHRPAEHIEPVHEPEPPKPEPIHTPAPVEQEKKNEFVHDPNWKDKLAI